MKRLKTYFIPALVFSALVLLFSCNADKLELTNPNNLSPETFFSICGSGAVSCRCYLRKYANNWYVQPGHVVW